MIDAQLLQCESDGSTVTVYSPWMRRGGDYALCSLQVVASTLQTSLSTISVLIFHKSEQDAGDGTQVGATTLSLSGNGIDSGEYGPFKDLVRYKISIAAGGSMDHRWALFRMLSPVWYDAVKA